jgi:hypothetical protein
LPTGSVVSKQSLFPETDEFFNRARTVARNIDAGTYEPTEDEPVKKISILTGLDTMWNRAKSFVNKDDEADHAPLETPTVEITEAESPEKIARRLWKEDNPTDTIHHQELLFEAGKTKKLPWQTAQYYPGYQNTPVADNVPTGPTGEVKGFGITFPTSAQKGDMFLRVDQLPSVLFKYNGSNWIKVDKNLTDSYAYDNAYIDHLIEKIGSGEYDPELLSDAEKAHIELRLQSNNS